jgi:transposase InsO family protein
MWRPRKAGSTWRSSWTEFSRLVVGWKLGETLEAALVVTGLQNALARRDPPRGLIFHSDQGCQYSSEAVRKPLTLLGARAEHERSGQLL